MKVVIISFMYGSEGGGASILAQRLADSLREQGNQVVIITTRRESGLEKAIEGGVTIYRFRPRNLYWVGDKDRINKSLRVPWQIFDIWNYHSYRVVKEILEIEKPDIVHTHKLRGLSPSIWMAAKAAGDLPVVHTCHDFELISPVGTLEGRIGRWAATGIFPFNLYQRIRGRFSEFVDLAIAPSRIVLDKHISRGFFNLSIKEVVPNTHGYTLAQIEEHRSALRQNQSKSDGLRVLFIGRLEPEKGVLTLVEAAEMAIQRGSKVRIDIVGSGSLLPTLRTRYVVQPNFVIHGPQFGELKDRLMRRTDVVIVPSEVEESFGLVVAEAFAFGKPVIATNMGALPAIIENLKTGFLIEPFDADGLAQLLEKLAKDTVALRGMRDACFASAREYSLERMRHDYLDIYRLAGRGGGE